MANRKKKLFKPTSEAKQKRKVKSLSEMERKMGQILVDFANASNADEAIYRLIDNMKLTFSLSDDFVNSLKSEIDNYDDEDHIISKKKKWFMWGELPKDMRKIIGHC